MLFSVSAKEENCVKIKWIFGGGNIRCESLKNGLPIRAWLVFLGKRWDLTLRVKVQKYYYPGSGVTERTKKGLTWLVGKGWRTARLGKKNPYTPTSPFAFPCHYCVRGCICYYITYIIYYNILLKSQILYKINR